ncbi:MAG: hypothetical protein KA149_01910 [Chitinophagales bacterium]|nr:hypothetical protein [Chitinophagales bacterium]
MKKIILLLFVASAFISSCSKKCDSGYEGNKCTTEVRAKYYATYSGTAVTNGNNATVDCIISQGSSGIHSLIVQGGLTNGVALEAILATNNDGSFVINQQVINASFTVSGSGAFNGNSINVTLNYPGAVTTTFNGTHP